MEAARLLRRGRLSQAEIARHLGVSRQSVNRWKQRLDVEGPSGLRHRPRTGRYPGIGPREWEELSRILERGAEAAGFESERWTLRRVAHVVENRFGIRYNFRSLGRVLHAHGWTPQRPAVRARERDDDLVEAWLKRDWPRIKRGLAREATSLPSWTRRVTRFGPV